MELNEALAFIHATDWKGSRLGLERMRELMRRLGNPQDSLKFIHVAGTNGKGSTAAMLASVLRAAGYRTGLFTSPYITRFEERMQVNGQETGSEELGIFLPLRHFGDAMERNIEQADGIALGFREEMERYVRSV